MDALSSRLLASWHRVRSFVHVGPIGVDEETSCALAYASGAHAQIRGSLRSDVGQDQ